MFDILRNCHTIFIAATLLHFSKQYTRVPIYPHLHQYLFSDLKKKKIVAILTFIFFETPPLLLTLPLANFRNFCVTLLAFEVPLKQSSKFRNFHCPSDVDECSCSLLTGKSLGITLHAISLVHWFYLFNKKKSVVGLNKNSHFNGYWILSHWALDLCFPNELFGRKVMTNLDSIFKSRDITLPTKVRLVKAMVFQWSCMDVRVGLWRKLSAEELMLLNCDVGEDSWESLGMQGDPTSPF